jgi:hypothetical protein
VRLCVKLQALFVYVAIEVDRQTRHASDGFQTADKYRTDTGHDYRPCQAEIAIKPGVQQRAAVGLDAQYCVALRAHVEPWA